MLVFVQWSLAVPRGWDEVDSSEWRSLPSKPVPAGGDVVDQKRGWVFGVNVQGVEFFGFDHIALADIDDGGVRVWGWNDDLDDVETRYRWGVVWDFLPPAFDEQVGQVNTRQSMIHYAEDAADFSEQIGGLAVAAWSDYPAPPADVVRHGVWLADELFAEHKAAQTVRGWREWVA